MRERETKKDNKSAYAEFIIPVLRYEKVYGSLERGYMAAEAEHYEKHGERFSKSYGSFRVLMNKYNRYFVFYLVEVNDGDVHFIADVTLKAEHAVKVRLAMRAKFPMAVINIYKSRTGRFDRDVEVYIEE